MRPLNIIIFYGCIHRLSVATDTNYRNTWIIKLSTHFGLNLKQCSYVGQYQQQGDRMWQQHSCQMKKKVLKDLFCTTHMCVYVRWNLSDEFVYSLFQTDAYIPSNYLNYSRNTVQAAINSNKSAFRWYINGYSSPTFLTLINL